MGRGYTDKSNYKICERVINLYSIISVQTIIVKPTCLLFNISVCICFSLLLQFNKNIREKKSLIKFCVMFFLDITKNI